MSKSSITVRDVFELPKPGESESEGWKTFGERVSEEVKGIKTAAMPDIAEKVAELFEIPIPDIFLASWKKASSLQAALEESRSAPEAVMNTELGEHTINSVHRPYIEIRIQNKTVKKIEFTLKLSFGLKGFVLKIQDGAIRGMQTGLCEVKGKLEYQDLVIAEKKLAPITLPGSVSLEGHKIEAQPEAKAAGATSLPESKEAGTKVEERPEALVVETEKKGSVKETGKTPEVIVAETPQTSGPVEAVEESRALETAGTAGTASAPGAGTEEVVERTTWEVGDDEPELETKRDAAENAVRDASSEGPEPVENPQDVIDRMSRELTDSRKTGKDVSEIGTTAKAGG